MVYRKIGASVSWPRVHLKHYPSLPQAGERVFGLYDADQHHVPFSYAVGEVCIHMGISGTLSHFLEK